jgi:translation initiation factor 2B subunit (eIF-2B alpha/beta/delta family)
LRISKRSGDEVWSTSAPGVRVHNDYFEEIPLTLLDGVVSDQGVYSPEDFRACSMNGLCRQRCCA